MVASPDDDELKESSPLDSQSSNAEDSQHHPDFPDANDSYMAQQVIDTVDSGSSPSLDPSPQSGKENTTLWTSGFIGLLVTQWLTAINDNVFRWLAIDIGKQYLPANPNTALMLGSIGFVAPFLILAAPAGFLADRFSKRTVIVICKLIELVAMSMGLIAIFYGQFYLLIATVFLMGAQTALFSPSKLGILPEFLGTQKLSAANGWMGLATMTATVIGMFVGGVLKDATGYLGREHNFGYTVGTLLGIAAVGVVFSWLIPKTAASSPETKLDSKTLVDWVTFRQAARDIRQLFDRRALFYVATGTVFFWMIAGVAQLNIDVLSSESGGALASDRTPLLVSLVLGVAIGNVLAGFLSAGKIQLGLVPIGCSIIIVFGVLLSLSPSKFYIDNGPWFEVFGTDATGQLVYACLLLFGLGTGAGLFDVPLASYLQHRAPAKSRGAILSATNFMVFGMMLLAFSGFSLLRAKTYDGSITNIPAVAAVTTGDQRDPVLGDEIQMRLEAWRVKWDEKVKSDLRTLRLEKERIGAKPTPKEAFELKNLAESLAVKRPPIEPVVQGVDDPVQRKAVLAMAMREELEARGLDEMQLPVREDKDKLNIDRESFAQQYSDDKRMAAEVYDQSLRQPLLSSRQIFLLISLATMVVFGILLKVLGPHTLKWFASIGRPEDKLKISGQQNVADGATVFLLHDSSDRNFQLLNEQLDRPMVRGRWKSGGLESGSNLAEILLEQNVGNFRDAKQVDASRLLRTLKDGASVLLPMFPSHEARINQPVPENLPNFLHQCRQAGFETIPVTIVRDENAREVEIRMGRPIEKPADVERIVDSFEQLGVDRVSQDKVDYKLPAEQFIRRCRQRLKRLKVSDSMGQEMTGGELLTRSAVLWRLLNRTLRADEQNVGVLVPPSAGGVLANTALALGGRTSVNLNYSVSEDIINECIRQAGIKHILTTKKVVDKLGYNLNAEVVYLEEIREKVTLMDKVAGYLTGNVIPIPLLLRSYGIDQRKQDDVFTLIFTSGSTGTPKGVMLTNRNIACVVDGIDQAVKLNDKDTILGVLPFFHSFGFSVPLWTVMGLDVAGTYHFNPLDPNQIGKLCGKYGATILLATPTFLRTYMKRVSEEDFKTLDVVVAGAEKLPVELSDAFEKKYGVRPVEGYGATELAPLVSVNQPASRVEKGKKQRIKEGSVGAAIANVTTKVIDIDTNQPAAVGEAGMLWIKGPNVMKGYLGREDLTAEVVVDGWYNTGDMAIVDEDGFIHITGRLSRFSKIGGEMVPHILVEEHLNDAVNEVPGDMICAVSSVPDAKKGEKLVVLHLPLPISVDELRSKLIAQGIPGLFIPAANAFYELPELPMLGSGKLDLKMLKQIAAEKVDGGNS